MLHQAFRAFRFIKFHSKTDNDATKNWSIFYAMEEIITIRLNAARDKLDNGNKGLILSLYLTS